MEQRVCNFYAGPAALPLEVLEEAKAELLNYKGCGMSVMEISHRSKTYDEIHTDAQNAIRDILGVSKEFHVLFLGGGASLQFAMVPYNFLKQGKVANYIDTGAWATKAIKEAKKLGEVNVIASSKDEEYSYIPSDFEIDKTACYLHITSNNTIRGTQWQSFPDTKGVPLICDMSSDFLSRKFDATQFSLIYAGAQKNVGPAGVTIVLIRDDMMGKIRNTELLTMLNYKTHVDKNSLFNTPPAFPVYMVGLVMKWIKKQGGLEKIEEINNKKASMVYECIDSSNGFYRGTAKKDSRSKMNITFRLPNEELEQKCIKQAEEKGLIGLKGHRSVGGMRASIYNAASLSAVEKLCDFLNEFRKKN